MQPDALFERHALGQEEIVVKGIQCWDMVVCDGSNQRIPMGHIGIWSQSWLTRLKHMITVDFEGDP